MVRLIILIIAFVVAGCAQQQQASQKPEINVAGYLYQVNAAKVKNGMSEAEVVAIMGDKPSSRSINNVANREVKALIWSHYNQAVRKAYAVSFQFVDDKVTGRSESGL